jgi:hypothetical protein
LPQKLLTQFLPAHRKKGPLPANVCRAHQDVSADAAVVESETPSSHCPDSVVSGLVVTLNDNPIARASAIERITAHPAISVAPMKDRWLPIAVEARDQRESYDIHDWLMALEGVEFVDVVSVSFAPEEESQPR